MRRERRALFTTLLVVAAAACGPRGEDPRGVRAADGVVATAGDWRDGGVCYEIFVRSFQDSDGDGVGDLRGLTDRLDYVNDGDDATTDDLGARCVWLMPINPSPSYHGYDVTDYYGVNPEYGTIEDFRAFVAAAHERGIHVLVDLIPNHTSNRHPWFLEAARDTASPYRAYYRWRDEPGPDNEWGDNDWRPSPERDEFYYGFFSPVMPDLNWASPAVMEQMERVADFWLEDMAVDGFRLDAVRHMVEGEDGRASNVAGTHDVLRAWEAHVRQVAPRAFTVGEVFDSTDVLRSYYPDQLDAYFAFQVANAIIASVNERRSVDLVGSVLALQDIVPGDRFAPFLRNHDQPRTMTELHGDVAGAKLAASLLLTLPGVPFVYYGEEIGMEGDKPDPRIRTPMQWSREPAAGFTTGTPWEPLQSDSLTANVAAMADDPASLLSHYRRLIHLRAATPALGSGALVPLETGSDQVVAWLRVAASDVAVVVANLGDQEAAGPAISSAEGALPAGSWDGTTLLGDGDPAPLTVGADGRLDGWTPLARLTPRTAYVVALSSG